MRKASRQDARNMRQSRSSLSSVHNEEATFSTAPQIVEEGSVCAGPQTPNRGVALAGVRTASHSPGAQESNEHMQATAGILYQIIGEWIDRHQKKKGQAQRKLPMASLAR